MLFAVDHGNSSIKTPNFLFTSGLASYPVKPPMETDVIEYGGKFWALSGQRISYMRDKTRDDRFFILTLFAIAQELKKRGTIPPMVETDLAVGLPPEHIGTLKTKFAEYFKRGNVQFAYNGAACCLVVRNVLVYPQAYAAMVSQAATIKETPRMFVVDIGGYTVDVLLLRYGRPDMQFCRSLEMGVISMSNEIIGTINAKYGIELKDDHVSDIIQGRPTILPPEVKSDVVDAVKGYAVLILDKLREIQVDLRADPATFIGGGSILFRPSIQSSQLVFGANFVEDPKANASGYEMLATAQLRMMAAQTGGDGFVRGQ